MWRGQKKMIQEIRVMYVSQRPLLSDVCIEVTRAEGLFKETIPFLILRPQKKHGAAK